MTHITVKKTKTRFSMTSEGHAGYADYGTDIVCAAISILVYSFAEVCIEKESNESASIDAMELVDGKAVLTVDDLNGEMESAVLMLKMGLSSIEKRYPKNLSVEWAES